MRSGAKRNELATKKVCDADVDLSIHTISNIKFLMELFHNNSYGIVFLILNGQENKAPVQLVNIYKGCYRSHDLL